MTKPLCLLLLSLALAPFAVAQQIDFPATRDEATLPAFAERVIAAYAEPDRERYLDNLFRLQLLAGKYTDAQKTLAMMPAAVANVRWEIYASAKTRQAAEGKSFDDAFRAAFEEKLSALDDRTAYRVLWSLGTSLRVLENGLRDALARHKDATTLTVADAVDLAKRYAGIQAFRSFQSTIATLMDEDDRRRYIIEKDVALKVADGATICSLIVRPRRSERLPALLNFTIYADPVNNLSEARRTAAYGFAGVVGLTRGKGCSPDKPVPYEHDGADAAALIDWISTQPWSDGRVGMYGGSYEGFTAWAAAKRLPKALKGIMNGAPVAPGIDVPMEGNVFWNFVYPWPFYTTNTKTLDDATYNDSARWNRLNREWYVSGRAYRDLEKIDGTPNPVFRRAIAHPSYDGYWRSMIPYGKEFARIDIPVLTTAGYYFGGPGAAVHYFTEHYKHRPAAEHYLVIGPYDHVRGHSGTIGVLGNRMTVIAGYELDPVAQLDMIELRYQWFDYVFKRGPKPALLQDKVNYEVTGANRWAHAPSLAAMADHWWKLHLKPAAGAFIAQTVNFADRSDADVATPGGGIVDKAIDTANSIVVTSDPVTESTEVSGLFSGRLDFSVNKRDFDFSVTLYELTSAGDYVLLAPYWTRASYAGHGSERRLLTANKRQRIDFASIRLMSRQLQPGSRVIVVLGVIKEQGRQINYGTGRDVSDETIADAKVPLRIKWFASSYVKLPVRTKP